MEQSSRTELLRPLLEAFALAFDAQQSFISVFSDAEPTIPIGPFKWTGPAVIHSCEWFGQPVFSVRPFSLILLFSFLLGLQGSNGNSDSIIIIFFFLLMIEHFSISPDFDTSLLEFDVKRKKRSRRVDKETIYGVK